MSLLVLRDDPHALVVADLTTNTLRLTWKGSVPSEHLRRVLIQGLMQVMQHRLTRWLSDSRKMMKVRSEDEMWLRLDFIPRMLSAGIERLALLPAPSGEYQQTVERISQSEHRPKFPYRICASLEEAELWLLMPEQAVA